MQILMLVDGEAEVHAGDMAVARRVFLALLRDIEETYHRSSQASGKPASGFLKAIAEHLRTHEKGHIAGYRYALTDLASGSPFCVATPASKLATATSQSAQAVLSQLWTDAQHHMAVDAARLDDKLAGESKSRRSEHHSERDGGATGLGGVDEQNCLAARLVAPLEQTSGPCAPSTGSGTYDGHDLLGASRSEEAQAMSTENQGPSASSSMAHRPADIACHVGPFPCGHMEIAAHTPGNKWVTARWALESELLQIDDTTTKDSYALAAAGRNVQSMLDKYFPGALGL